MVGSHKQRPAFDRLVFGSNRSDADQRGSSSDEAIGRSQRHLEPECSALIV